MGVIANLIVKIGADISDLQSGMARAQSVSSGLVMGMGAAAAAVGAVGIASIVAAGKMESTATAFTTMLGSAEKSTALLKDLQKFAATTPFEFTEIQQASKSLLAFGVNADDMTSTLRSLGDVSSGVGAPIKEIAELYGKAKVQGRLFAEDINQLTGRGIPIIQELAKQFGVSENEVKNLVESGQVGFPQLEQAFKDMTKEGSQFGGMMEDQSATLPGLWSNLMDSIGQSSVVLGQELIEAFNIKGVITDVVAALGDFTALLQEKGIAGALDEIFNDQTKMAIFAVAGALTVAMIPALIGVATAAAAAVLPLLPFIAAGAALGALAYLIYENWSSIAPMFDGLGGSFDGIIEAWDNLSTVASRSMLKVQEIFNSSAPAIMAALAPIGDLFKTLWANIQPVFTYLIDTMANDVIPAVMALYTAFMMALPGIITFVQPVFEVLTNLFSFIANFVGLIVAVLTGDWAGAWNFAGAMVQNMVDTVGSILNFLLSIVTGIFTAVGAGIMSILAPIGDWIGNLFAGAYNSIVATWTQAIEFYQMINEMIINAFLSIPEVLASIFMSAWNSVQNVWGGVVGWFRGIADGIGNAFSGVGDSIVNGIQWALDWLAALPGNMVTWGYDFIQGMIDGINGALSGLTGTIENIAGTITSFLHFSRPDKGALRDYETWMPDFMAGLAGGITGNMSLVTNAVKGVSDTMDLKGKIKPVNINTGTNTGNGNLTAAQSSSQQLDISGEMKIVVEGLNSDALNNPVFLQQVEQAILDSIKTGNRSIPTRTSLIPI